MLARPSLLDFKEPAGPVVCESQLVERDRGRNAESRMLHTFLRLHMVSNY
jgi:hypothetical protein